MVALYLDEHFISLAPRSRPCKFPFCSHLLSSVTMADRRACLQFSRLRIELGFILCQSDLEGPQQKGDISLRCVFQARTMCEYAMG